MLWLYGGQRGDAQTGNLVSLLSQDFEFESMKAEGLTDFRNCLCLVDY